MNRLINTTIIQALILILSSNLYAGSAPITLNKNPFIKPIELRNKEVKRLDPIEVNEPLSESSLRATLSSGDQSIANVDGIMVFLGDKVKGYELIHVGEGTAIFMKDNKELSLSVSEKHKQLK
jgi:hypothetical protein